MKTKIIMVRHGQSVANAQNRFAGHSDFDLTDLGRTQARLSAQYLAKIETPDVIYSSDLLRAHNTAAPFAEIYSLPINDRTGLRELYAGKWEGLELDKITELYGDDFDVWKNDFSYARCTGGESIQELYERIVAEVLSLVKQNPDKTLLITTHATPIRAIEAYANGLPAHRIHEINFVKNASINIFEYDFESDSLYTVRTNVVEQFEESLVTDVPKLL